jgi:hypothetical protein
MNISRADQATLDSIEALLVAQKASVRDALHTAYQLGRVSGKIEILKINLGIEPEFEKAA